MLKITLCVLLLLALSVLFSHLYSEELICITEEQYQNLLNQIDKLSEQCQILRMLLEDLLKSNQKDINKLLMKYEEYLLNQKQIEKNLRKQIENLECLKKEREKEYKHLLTELDQLQKELKISENLLKDLKKNNLMHDLKIAGGGFSLGVIFMLIIKFIIRR